MTKCKHHPEKPAVVRGLCQACYMRERRAGQRAEYRREYDANVRAQVKGVTTKGRDVAPTGAGVLRLIAVWSHDLADRFRAKIDASAGPDACHVWLGTKIKGGYGMASLGGRTVLAHRLAHALATGDATAEVVMHTCDNPSCVNPAHLRSGTHMENTADKMAKGRGASGERLGRHLRDRTKHPAAKRVQTPYGIFPSASLASVAVGKTPRTVARYCQTGEGGWTYLD
jgi:hypothetical protein